MKPLLIIASTLLFACGSSSVGQSEVYDAPSGPTFNGPFAPTANGVTLVAPSYALVFVVPSGALSVQVTGANEDGTEAHYAVEQAYVTDANALDLRLYTEQETEFVDLAPQSNFVQVVNVGDKTIGISAAFRVKGE